MIIEYQIYVLCSAEKSSVIWAEPHSGSSAEQLCRTERSVDHYDVGHDDLKIEHRNKMWRVL